MAEYLSYEGTTPQDSIYSVEYEDDVVGVLDLMIQDAYRMKASDIHIEPKKEWLEARFRVDGQLLIYKKYSTQIEDYLIRRLKILASLKIDEIRLPQDGKVTIKLDEKRDIELRVSIMNTVYGQNAVIRILTKENDNLTLKDLGYRDEYRAKVEAAFKKSDGLILCAGPTGSGKSTTLYCALRGYNPKEFCISTLEDPVEYQIPGANQTQVQPEIGFTFATGLRALVRQDLDIMMVGEIRDHETAELAVDAALTGHLVFSTIHANSSAGTIVRLINMGAEPFLLASALRVIISHRLVRKVCPHCRIKYDPDETTRQKVHKHIWQVWKKPMEFYLANEQGCDNCKHTGYAGRVGVYEVLEITPRIKEMIFKQASETEIHKVATEEGMITMPQDALFKVLTGLTTLDEVFRKVDFYS